MCAGCTVCLSMDFSVYRFNVLTGLAAEYKHRRDYFVQCLNEEFHLERSLEERGVWKGCNVYGAYAKPRLQVKSEKEAPPVKMFSFVPPSSGMFVWVSRTCMS